METHSSNLAWRIPDGGAWRATLHRVAETCLKRPSVQACRRQRYGIRVARVESLLSPCRQAISLSLFFFLKIGLMSLP